MNEIVKIHNDLTNEMIGKMDARELDLFMSICVKLRDKGTSEMIIYFDELRNLSNYQGNSNERMRNDLKKTNEDLLKFVITTETEEFIEQKSLFDVFRISKKEALLTVKIRDEFTYILNNIATNFNMFELSEFVSLNSKYSKKLYKILKQFRSTGKVHIKKEDFYIQLDIPMSYKVCDLNKRVLQPSIKELSKYFIGLKCIPIKEKSAGSPLIGYEFSFKKEVYSAQAKSISESLIKSNGNTEKQTGKKKNEYNRFMTRSDDEIKKDIEFLENMA